MQCQPSLHTGSGPTGHVYDGIVWLIGLVAGKDGEAQVVAYLQEEAHTTELGNYTLLSGGVSMMLSAIGKEMMLVVESTLGIGANKAETVVVSAILLHHRHTTGHGGIQFHGHGLHPLQRGTCTLLPFFGHPLGLSGKAGREHFGQYIQAGLLHAAHHISGMIAVSLWIGPLYVCLYKVDFHNHVLAF